MVVGTGHDSDETMSVGGAEAPADSTAKTDEGTGQYKSPNRGKTGSQRMDLRQQGNSPPASVGEPPASVGKPPELKGR